MSEAQLGSLPSEDCATRSSLVPSSSSSNSNSGVCKDSSVRYSYRQSVSVEDFQLSIHNGRGIKSRQFFVPPKLRDSPTKFGDSSTSRKEASNNRGCTITREQQPARAKEALPGATRYCNNPAHYPFHVILAFGHPYYHKISSINAIRSSLDNV